MAVDSTKIFRTPGKMINALKRFQRRELLRIGARDLLSHAELAPTTAELSMLADSLIAASALIAWQQTVDQFGECPDSTWVIYGLGKLGGKELNYSSDIDLLAVYQKDERFQTLDEVIRNFSRAGMNHSYRFFLRRRRRDICTASTCASDPMEHPARLSVPLTQQCSTMNHAANCGNGRCLSKHVSLPETQYSAADCWTVCNRLYPRSLFANPLNEIARIKTRIEAQSGDAHNLKLCPGESGISSLSCRHYN